MQKRAAKATVVDTGTAKSLAVNGRTRVKVKVMVRTKASKKGNTSRANSGGLARR